MFSLNFCFQWLYRSCESQLWAINEKHTAGISPALHDELFIRYQFHDKCCNRLHAFVRKHSPLGIPCLKETTLQLKHRFLTLYILWVHQSTLYLPNTSIESFVIHGMSSDLGIWTTLSECLLSNLSWNFWTNYSSIIFTLWLNFWRGVQTCSLYVIIIDILTLHSLALASKTVLKLLYQRSPVTSNYQIQLPFIRPHISCPLCIFQSDKSFLETRFSWLSS